MTSLGLARAVALASVGIVIGLVGCTSDAASQPATFCGAASSTKCKEPSACDTAIGAGCSGLDEVVGASTLKAAQDCLESGVCGMASCLSRAQKSAAPTKAHRELAESFCAFCAPDVENCESQFYARKARLPGALVLPYSAEIARAVNDECTGDRDACRSKFATCATETIARIVGETLDGELADCVVSGFRNDESGSLPGGGPEVTSCTPANCDGCCRDDKCEKGTSENACGEGAAACETCSGAQKCTAGKCKEPCGPNNCKGCCDGDTCVSGTVTETCGADGASCTSCTTQGASFVCSNQTCIDGSCQATCVNGCSTAAGCQART